MNSKQILKAATRARLFLQAAEKYLAAERKYADAHLVVPGDRALPVESGALRRSSLDLSRQLSTMRNTKQG